MTTMHPCPTEVMSPTESPLLMANVTSVQWKSLITHCASLPVFWNPSALQPNALVGRKCQAEERLQFLDGRAYAAYK